VARLQLQAAQVQVRQVVRLHRQVLVALQVQVV
jgi:hypothetical protein